MRSWKKILLGSYYYATLPWRQLGMLRFRRSDSAPLIVLFYHRVTDCHVNSWSMSREDFARHIHWLRDFADLVSLPEIQRRMQNGPNQRTAVSITFDDGYAENCDFALPLLLQERIPFTYFVTTRNVLTGEPFPHDVACGCPLRPNSIDQVQRLADAGVEIGAHTRTHPDLGRIHEDEQLYDEVVAARDDLQECLSTPVRYFAFPYGHHTNLNPKVFELARAAGFAGVCSAYGGYNLPGDDPFHLQRIHGDPEFVRFRSQVSDDPLQRFVKRYPVKPVPVTRETEAVVGTPQA